MPPLAKISEIFLLVVKFGLRAAVYLLNAAIRFHKTVAMPFPARWRPLTVIGFGLLSRNTGKRKSRADAFQCDAPLLGAGWRRCGLTTRKRRGRLGAIDDPASQRMTLPLRNSGRTSSAGIGGAK